MATANARIGGPPNVKISAKLKGNQNRRIVPRDQARRGSAARAHDTV
jgi:hypothetical protein